LHGTGIEVVGEVGVAEGIVEVTTADHEFEIGDEESIGAEVARANEVGALEGLVAGGAGDLMELCFEAEMGAQVEVHVCGEAAEVILFVVGVGEGVSGAELEVAGTRGGGCGLGMK
jgi:hypothetical protein